MGVTIAGPMLAIAVAFSRGAQLSSSELQTAVMLVVLGAIGERYPLHLTHKTNINVASAAYFAMVLTLPWQMAGLLALTSLVIGLELRRRSHDQLDYVEMLFNVAQGALYTTVGAALYTLLGGYAIGPTMGERGQILQLVGAAIGMHLVNTALVSIAAGLQLGVSPVRVWWRNIALDLTPHVTLTVVGSLAAMIAERSPFFVPLLALPGFLVQRAVQETVQLRADTHEALASLVEVVELRDPYTAGHSRRVATVSRLLALQLGLTAEEADTIESAGRVHDIGKVAIDPHILMKTTQLTAEEWEQMQLHPVHGANVIDRFAAYRLGAKYVRHHHERWDGGGYPDRIAGDEIPLGARILAVADSFDAMTSDRPYRSGMPIAKALSILSDGAGSQWDPRVVQGFITLIAERPGDMPIFRRDETSASVASALLNQEHPDPQRDEAA